MIATIIAAAALFAATNLDDIVLLTVLYAGAGGGAGKRKLLVGRYLGTAILTVLSILGARGAQLIPERYIGLLGIVPILLGVKAIFDRHGDDGAPAAVSAASVMLVTLSSGADNLGVYIPAFVAYTVAQLAVTAAVFAAMTAVLCIAAERLAGLPLVGEKIEKYKRIIVPVVFIALGVMILAEAYLFG